MCGLFAALGVNIGAQEINILKHRGPDGFGRREFPTPVGPLVLGHRRLAIIDPDSRSDQPMSTADQKLHIILNGEIYNYQEIREQLIKAGHHFSTTSDTEVLLLGYRQWGPLVLDRLVGMFAFAIADFNRGILFLARDQFGIKPLYYASAPQRFGCASEIKALLVLPFVSRQVNSEVAIDFLEQGLVEHRPESVFKDVTNLAPGHWLEVSLDTGRLGTPRRYWTPRPGSGSGGKPNNVDEELRRVFDESVRLHLVSDVPVGATLSGGLDSTLIVGTITKDLAPGVRLPTYSFISEDEAVSEEHWIDIITSRQPVTTHKVRATFDDFERDMDRMIVAQDIPLQGPSIYAEYKVFELVRKTGIKVVVGGQGADEMFGGYHPYMMFRILSLLYCGSIGAAWQLANFYNKRMNSSWGSLAKNLVALALPPLRRPRLNPYQPWIDRNWTERAGVKLQPTWRPHGREVLRERLRHAVFHDSLPAHLHYEDHNAMLHGIESRVPFVVCRLAELAFSLPEEDLISSNGVTKAIMRRVFADRIPPEILNRKDKIGFAAPDRAWLIRMAPQIAQYLDSCPEKVGPVDTKILKDNWLAMAGGQMPLNTGLWRIFFFVKWAQLLKVEFAH